MISKKLAKWIAYHPKTVLIVCLILIIPSIIGYFLTGVNYDILSYLPENLESVQGEQILDETFHNSASSFIIVKDTAFRKRMFLIIDITFCTGWEESKFGHKYKSI